MIPKAVTHQQARLCDPGRRLHLWVSCLPPGSRGGEPHVSVASRVSAMFQTGHDAHVTPPGCPHLEVSPCQPLLPCCFPIPLWKAPPSFPLAPPPSSQGPTQMSLPGHTPPTPLAWKLTLARFSYAAQGLGSYCFSQHVSLFVAMTPLGQGQR